MAMPVSLANAPDLMRTARKFAPRAAMTLDSQDGRSRCIRIALVNNMPDAALEETESQFIDLLQAASGESPVQISLFSLPEISRGPRGKRRVEEHYSNIVELWDSPFDGVIITGTEPRQPDLRQEPYWPTLTKIIDWAAENTISAVLSCLAAHAGVLYLDDVERNRLKDKQFGVFEYRKTKDHSLMKNSGNRVRIPHSRWNEVREEDLASAGYTILTRSSRAGVDLFLKQRKKCLLVHFQGHPEYGALTLLKEYRRDIKRFVRQEQDTYPNMPLGYFNAAASLQMIDFQQKALARPHETLLRNFPEAAVADTLEKVWHQSAVSLYGNWLRYIESERSDILRARCAAPTGLV
jgi:homoserine O-succinyltransferase/O-acetyltransferase